MSSTPVNPEDVDLRALALEIQRSLAPGEPEGYLRGKAVMRDLLVQKRGFSELQAEDLIDTLELRGFLHFQDNTAERSHAHSHWRIDPEHL